jgi:hypothetical protein
VGQRLPHAQALLGEAFGEFAPGSQLGLQPVQRLARSSSVNLAAPSPLPAAARAEAQAAS